MATMFLIDPRDVKRLDRRFCPVRSKVRYLGPVWFRVGETVDRSIRVAPEPGPGSDPGLVGCPALGKTAKPHGGRMSVSRNTKID